MPNLTRASTRVEALMPDGWRMMGVVRGPREVDPYIRRETWAAWARGPNGEFAKGEGDDPVHAVSDLANQLDKVRGISERLGSQGWVV